MEIKNKDFCTFTSLIHIEFAYTEEEKKPYLVSTRENIAQKTKERDRKVKKINPSELLSVFFFFLHASTDLGTF